MPNLEFYYNEVPCLSKAKARNCIISLLHYIIATILIFFHHHVDSQLYLVYIVHFLCKSDTSY